MSDNITKRTSTPKYPKSGNSFLFDDSLPFTPIISRNSSSSFEPIDDSSVGMPMTTDEVDIADDSMMDGKENMGKDFDDVSMRSDVDKSIVQDSFGEDNVSVSSSSNDVSRDRSVIDTSPDKAIKHPELFTPQTRKEREHRLQRKRSDGSSMSNDDRKTPINFNELSDDNSEIKIDSSASFVDATSFAHGQNQSKRRIIINSSSDESVYFNDKPDCVQIDDSLQIDSAKATGEQTIDISADSVNENDSHGSITINSLSDASGDESVYIDDSDSDDNHKKGVGNMLDPVTIDSSDECSEDEKPVVLTVDEKLSVQKMKRDEVLHDLQNLKKIDLSSAPDRGIKIKSRIALLKYRLTIPFDDEADAISKPQIPKADMEKYMNGEKRIFGGKMTEARRNDYGVVTDEVLQDIHKSLENRPENVVTETPEGITVDLMMHQKYGLSMMKWMEDRRQRGGILADDMGLGKTLSMIALIVAQKNTRNETPANKEMMQQTLLKHFKKENGVTPAFSTLVVAPASVIFQWEKEINDRVKPGKLKVCVFHGPKREKNPRLLAKHDVVITTYNIIASELGEMGEDSDDEGRDGKLKAAKKKISKENYKSVLTQIGWERIILDEAHIIKNRRSLTSKACCRLFALRRWALTGTPIHNCLYDLYSLVKFLRVGVFAEESCWKDLMMNSEPAAAERLNTLVKAILIRRTKNQICPISKQPIINLKPRTFEIVEVVLEGLEDKCYQHMFEASRQKAKELINEQNNTHTRRRRNEVIKNPFITGRREINSADNFQMMSCLLVLLLRLRQACVHMSLTSNAVDLDAFKDDGGDEDAVMDDLEKTFGNISLSAGDFLAKENASVDAIFKPTYVSGKMKILLQKLNAVIEAGDKCVIVSQWTSMLDIIEMHLQQKHIKMTTISGKILTKDRQERIDSFNKKNGGAQIMLLSLTAGGVGLNLIGGNHLFLVDLHWNPALEKQACDRIYRVGQQKNVFIHKFICKGTIEQRVLDLQEKKTQLSDSVLDGAAKLKNKLTVMDLKYLFSLNKETIPKPQQPYEGPANVRHRP